MHAMARSRLIQALLARDGAASARSGELAGIVDAVGGADLAEILLAAGDGWGALDALERLLGRIDEGGLRRDHAAGSELLARALASLNRVDDAAAAAERAVTEATVIGFRSVLWRAHLTRASARDALSDARGAEDDRATARRIVGDVAASIVDGALATRFLENVAVTYGLG
jgi:hypothetical protein